MSYFSCYSAKYILLQNSELDLNGNVAPKPGFEFIELSAQDKLTFSEEGKNKSGNPFYEQSLDIIFRYDLADDIRSLHNSLLILELTRLDGSKFIWGGPNPLNPVQVSMNTEKAITELKLTRNTLYPEI